MHPIIALLFVLSVGVEVFAYCKIINSNQEY